MYKKAQAATEYLIILAVVVIIALIVVAVMGGIPGIGKSASGRASGAYWATADVAISAASVSATGAGQFVLKNNMRNAVTVTTLTVGTSADLIATDIQIVPGGTTTITAAAAAITPACTANTAYAYSVSLTYNEPLTGRAIALTGDGATLDGTCTA
jgi:hypothetical protein